MSSSENFQNFFNTFGKHLAGQSRNYFGQYDIDISPFDRGSKLTSYWTCFSILYSSNFTIYFKFFFDSADVICMPNFSHLGGHGFAKDVGKEYCNLMLGVLKRSIDSQGIKCETSLPVCITSYDNLLFSNIQFSDYEMSWKLKNMPDSVSASIHLANIGKGAEEELNGVSISIQQEVEFL